MEHVVGWRARVPDAVSRDVDVRPFLPRVAGGGDVDRAVPQLVLGDRVEDWDTLDANLRDVDGESLIFGPTGVPPKVEGPYNWYGPGGRTGGDKPLRRLPVSLVVEVAVLRRLARIDARHLGFRLVNLLGGGDVEGRARAYIGPVTVEYGPPLPSRII